MTVLELIKDDVAGREIYNYRIVGPISLDDEAALEIHVAYGSGKDYPDGITHETYKLKLQP